MRTVLLSYFALNLSMIASVALAQSATGIIPSSTRLTESQMDTVTAGMVGITVTASARASGPGSTSAYAAVAIQGDSVEICLGDGFPVSDYSLQIYPKPVIKMDSDNTSSPGYFIHFQL